MSDSLITKPEKTALEMAGAAANSAAGKLVFEQHQHLLSKNTIRQQVASFEAFRLYLEDITGINAGDFMNDPDAWKGVTWGIIQGFVKWMMDNGYAIKTINVRLSAVKSYAKLAAQAGVISPDDLKLIETVKGVSDKAARRVDTNRDSTRVGDKKATHTHIPSDAARLLLSESFYPNTPQGKRDWLIMVILADMGFRVGEVALLTVEQCDRLNGVFLNVYRPKVSKTQNHKMSPRVLDAVDRYLKQGCGPTTGPLLRGSDSAGMLTNHVMSERGIFNRVAILGAKAGIEHLGPHDWRHRWATIQARRGTPLLKLMEAGGWSSSRVPLMYIEAAAIANDGVNFEGDD